jgi:outer membrane protein insertion porin family
LTFGIGFSTVDSAVADVTIQERNLLGKGQDLSASFQISARSQQIDLSFTEPYFLDRNLAAGFDVFRTSSNRQSESSFDSAHVGFALRAGYGVTQNLRHSVRYLIQSETISDVGSDASQFIIDQTGTSVTSAIGQSLSYDVRNDTLRPTDGFIIRFDQTLAGLGGSKQYLKNELNYAFYYPVADDWIAIARLREGYIVGIGQDVGITDRFFLGGSSFKGFQPGGLGPRDTSSGDALGGNLLYVGTTELLFPLGFPRELGVLGRVFSQFGSLAHVDETGDNLFDVGSLRMSAGFGISWISPFGPIEIDYATVLKKEAIDETQSLFVSFGTRF